MIWFVKLTEIGNHWSEETVRYERGVKLPSGTSTKMSLANPDSSLRKTNESSLMTTLYNDIPPVESFPENSACIFDGMSVVQKVVHAPDTFGQLADKLFSTIFLQADNCQRLDLLFDVYREISI